MGIGEGTVDEMAKPLYDTPGVGLARTPAPTASISVSAPRRTRARRPTAKIHPVETEMERIFGNAIWGRDEDTMEGYVADQMHERRTTLAVIEILHRGANGEHAHGRSRRQRVLPRRLCELFDAADRPWRASRGHRGVRRGRPGPARAMAEAARRKAGADFGIGITGVAGPDPEDGIPRGPCMSRWPPRKAAATSSA